MSKKYERMVDMKLIRRKINPTKPSYLNLESSEAEYVRSLIKQGKSKEDIIKSFGSKKSDEKINLLLISYYLGEVSGDEVLSETFPKEPKSIVFKKKIEFGYWLEAHGKDAEFNVVLRAPELEEDKVKELVENNQEDFCWLAYKNHYEGKAYPCDLGESINGVAATGISIPFEEITPLLK